jgi:hypothetical protein
VLILVMESPAGLTSEMLIALFEFVAPRNQSVLELYIKDGIYSQSPALSAILCALRFDASEYVVLVMLRVSEAQRSISQVLKHFHGVASSFSRNRV